MSDSVVEKVSTVDSAGNIVDPPPEEKKPRLPIYPKPLREWNESEIRYTGDKDDMMKRIQFKLYNIWCMWSQLQENQALNEKLMEKTEEDTDLFKMKYVVVDIMDALAKFLSDTNIVDEILFLGGEKKN